MNSIFNPPDKLSQLRREKEEAALEPMPKPAHIPAAHVPAAHVPAAHVSAAHVPAAHVSAAHVSAAHVSAAHAPALVRKSYVKKITRCIRCEIITKGFLRCFNCNELHKIYNS